MATLSKIGDQYRVRYQLHLPNGGVFDRSRRVDKKGHGREIKAIATIMESQTLRQEYSADDINHWLREGVISKKDAAELSQKHNHTKTLQQAVDEYRITWNKISQQERKTRDARCERILALLGPTAEIGNITYLDGERLKTQLSQMQVHTHNSIGTKPLKARTINRHIADLKRIFKIQLAQRAIDHFPFTLLEALAIPTDEQITPTVLTLAQIQIVIDDAEQRDQQSYRPPLGGHLTLYLLMFFGCGIRRKEAMEAELKNIDWSKRTLLLTKTKTGKPRTIGLGQRLFKLLLPRKGKRGLILPPFSRSNISEVVKRHFAKNGITMRLHDTRHTYATRLLDLGVDKRLAATRTGHSDSRMLDHYDHPEAPEIYEDGFDFMQ